ncbi:MAG: tetratricopeptide repeat protein [Candidatus Aminicenantes bacterium]|nr:tetratricopeptide repeat protein [Candidatus Aminicenantes bacterium]
MTSVRAILAAALAAGLAACAPAARRTASVDNEKNPQYQYEKAVIAMNYGLPEEALRYVELALALDPGHALSHRLAGIIRLQNREPGPAAESFAKWLEAEPDSAEGHLYLGLASQEAGDKERAEAAFRASFEAGGSAQAAFRLGTLLLEKGELEEALAYADRAIAKAGREKDGHNLRGVILNQMGRYSEAVAGFEAAVALAPDDPALLVNLAIACLNGGATERARALFQKALPMIKDAALRDKIRGYLESIEESPA